MSSGTLAIAATFAILAATVAPAAAAPPLDAVDDTASPLRGDGTATVSLLANDIGQDGLAANCVGPDANCEIDSDSLFSEGQNGILEINAESGEATYITTIDPAVDPAGYAAIAGGTPCAGLIDTFTYTLNGALEGLPVPDSTDTATVSVRAGTGVRDPDAQPDTATAQAGVPVTGNALVNDCDQTNATPPRPENVAVTITGQPTGGTATIAPDGTYTYTPRANFSGTDQFAYTLTTTDAGPARTASTTVTIQVSPAPGQPNRAPVATPGFLFVNAGTTGTIKVGAFDLDNDPLTFTVITQPQFGTITGGAGGVYTYTAAPSPVLLRLDTFQVRVCDPQMACSTATSYVLIYKP